MFQGSIIIFVIIFTDTFFIAHSLLLFKQKEPEYTNTTQASNIINTNNNNNITKNLNSTSIITESRNLKTITILGLFELTTNGTKRINGVSEKFAAELAIHDINRKRILKKYRLSMLTNDTKCDAGVGVDAFFHALYTKKNVKILSLLGTACSEVTERLAKVVPYWNIVQVSFGSTSPSLSDRQEFPLFYRTVSPASSHNEAIISFIRNFGWDTVTFFTQNENRFTMPLNYLVTDLEKSNVTCKATVTFSKSDLRVQIQNLKELDSRIIIASFSTQLAPKIFCEVYKMGIYGSDYAWILIGRPERRWWVIPGERDKKPMGYSTTTTINKTTVPHTNNIQFDQIACTYDELSQTMENAIVVDRHNFIVQNMNSVSGMSAKEFRTKFQVRNLPDSPFAPEAYDAVWTIALALRNVQEKYNISLQEFQYNSTEFSSVFMKEMSALVFNGISGPISFVGADRIGVTSFLQIHGKRMNHVGLYFPRLSALTLNCSGCSVIRWHGNQVPIARREFRFKLVQVDGTIYACIAILSTGGILLAITFLLFNLYNRKLKYIKLSSPRLNNMVIIGCIFAYIAVFLLGSNAGLEEDGKHFAYICTIRAYLLSTGFSLAFGAMFAKTYRVHRIFTRSCIGVVKNKLLRDRQLMTLIMSLLCMDCFIVTSWAVVDPMERNLQNLSLEIDPSDRSVVYQQQIKVCRSHHGHVWLSVVYGYKSLLLAVGLFMAWETRHVKIQVLNDSKYIGLCVYIVVLTSVLAVSLANLLSDKVTLSFITVTSLILTATTITLCLLFLPKIHAIIRKRHIGDPVVKSSGLKIEFNTRRFMVEDSKELLFRAEVQNRVYKRQIEAINVELWRVEKLLMGSNSNESLNLQTKKKVKILNENMFQESASVASNEESSSSSEIYTVYLHGPRYIIPISLLNTRNGTKNITDIRSIAAFAASAITGPRSSWPTTRHSTRRSKSHSFKYKSEPDFLQDNTQMTDVELNDEDVTTLEPLNKNRKDSSGSTRSRNATTTKPSLLSVLKIPYNYITGLLLRPPLTTTMTQSRNIQRVSTIEEISLGAYLNEGDEIQKCSSVPDLWASRHHGTSPTPMSTIGTKSKHSTSASFNTHHPCSLESVCIRDDNPVLRLVVTSDESPYL